MKRGKFSCCKNIFWIITWKDDIYFDCKSCFLWSLSRILKRLFSVSKTCQAKLVFSYYFCEASVPSSNKQNFYQWKQKYHLTKKEENRQITKGNRKSTTNKQQCQGKVDEGKNQGCQKCGCVVKNCWHTIRQSTRAKKRKKTSENNGKKARTIM